jgi:hypothetical protein
MVFGQDALFAAWRGSNSRRWDSGKLTRETGDSGWCLPRTQQAGSYSTSDLIADCLNSEAAEERRESHEEGA